MNCKPQTFSGTEGVVGLMCWLEKAESVFAMCNCLAGDRVKYASGTLEDGALTWWNAQVQMLGIEMCGDAGHFRRDCPQLNQNAGNSNNNNIGNNNNGNNGGNGARGRVFTIGAGEARNDGNVVTGTFFVNDLFASILFDSGADWSYVSLEFSRQLRLTPTPLVNKHVVELADGKSIEASHVLFGCKLDLMGQVFDIDLLPVTLGSFDVVVGMDWLSKHQAEILYKEKIMRIPLPSGESLSVQGHRSGAMVGIISAMKAQKCLQKGYPAILALVTDTQPEERKIEDLPVVLEFSDVFPEELPSLPPHRQEKRAAKERQKESESDVQNVESGAEKITEVVKDEEKVNEAEKVKRLMDIFRAKIVDI
ncbi:uncharacterized protein LOC118491469 [Helianthus annuus]|uniref:uncharacterized protein LOC118491469 n=1 Tax=Helianthus annuus TaxID=4232 RepID=UPI001652E43C|nr:uncharacterized protein LOC118491469 [Helianthus annuus]